MLACNVDEWKKALRQTDFYNLAVGIERRRLKFSAQIILNCDKYENNVLAVSEEFVYLFFIRPKQGNIFDIPLKNSFNIFDILDKEKREIIHRTFQEKKWLYISVHERFCLGN